MGGDNDVGKAVRLQESADPSPYVPASIICELPFFWVVKLYCPYDPEDPFLTQVVDVVDSCFDFWKRPAEAGVDYPIDERKERCYLLEGNFFVTGWLPFSLFPESFSESPNSGH